MLKTLTQPKSNILMQGNDMHKVLNRYHSRTFIKQDKTVDRELLGYCVKWEGGNHVIQYQDYYYICEKIEDAQYEEI